MSHRSRSCRSTSPNSRSGTNSTRNGLPNCSAADLPPTMPLIPARRGERLTFATLLGLVVLLAVVPIARLAQEALAPHGRLDAGVLASVLESPVVWRAARNTLSVSVGGAALAIVLGTAFALLVSLTDVRAKKPLVFCFMMPLLIAPQVTALAWINLLGPNSTLLRVLGIAPAAGSAH